MTDLKLSKTRYASIHRFKGLEAERWCSPTSSDSTPARERDLFYVGATRATQRLVVLANEALRGRLRLSS